MKIRKLSFSLAIGIFMLSGMLTYASGYTPLYPIYSSGEDCNTTPGCIIKLDGPAKTTVAKTQRQTVASPDKGVIGGGDNKFEVKGNDNDVTPQNIKQAQKQKTAIKGNHNTVKKIQSQIGVNVKSRDNSPITVYVNGPSIDGTCPPGVNCQGQITIRKDKDGNIIQEGSVQDKKNLIVGTPSATTSTTGQQATPGPQTPAMQSQNPTNAAVPPLLPKKEWGLGWKIAAAILIILIVLALIWLLTKRQEHIAERDRARRQREEVSKFVDGRIRESTTEKTAAPPREGSEAAV